MTRETYSTAGIHRSEAEQAKERIKRHVRSTFGPQVVGDVGFFGGLYRLQEYNQAVLVSSADGVGTKLKLAIWMDCYDTVGQDIVNHCINDVFASGARPLFFLDYIAMGVLRSDRVELLVAGMAEACRTAGCVLIGGETAEMPGMYHGDDFDLAGFLVGAVEQDEIKDGSTIQQGDVLLGLPSSGLHTNGYSLVRRIWGLDANISPLKKRVSELGRTLGDALLEPHRPYYPLMEQSLPFVKGMAHITGGGLLENVPRMLPEGLAARIERTSWDIPPLFRIIQGQGDVEEREMFQVFNMGVGMVVACSPEHENEFRRSVPDAWVMGEVIQDTDTDQRVVFEDL